MEWVRGDVIGQGSFGTVSLAKPRTGVSLLPSLMAVKSADTFGAVFLKKEKQILDQLGSACPEIIHCFGDDYTVENGENLYNVLLEYASKGSLAELLKKDGGQFQESYVRRYVRSILKGLRYIHAKGFAHCDIKLQNILVSDNGDVKIADFGLARKTGEENQSEEQGRVEFRGTPLYMAPESVNDNEYESPADIWALGCAVVEMISGKPAWNFKPGSNIAALLIKIGASDELPIIPGELSDEGKDFLGKCFVKDPRARWTAEMLLDHPFIAGEDTVSLNCAEEEEEASTSPRGPFDFQDWISAESISCVSTFPQNSRFLSSFSGYFSSPSSPLDRIHGLLCNQAIPNWSVSGSWATVRYNFV